MGARIAEAAVVMREDRRRVFTWQPNGKPFLGYTLVHQVLIVETKAGNSYVVDLSGPQFDIPAVIFPWKQYRYQFLTGESRFRIHGTCKAKLESLVDEIEPGPETAAHLHRLSVQRKMVACMEEEVTEWTKRNGRAMHQMLQLDIHLYDAAKEELLTALQTRLRAVVTN